MISDDRRRRGLNLKNYGPYLLISKALSAIYNFNMSTEAFLCNLHTLNIFFCHIFKTCWGGGGGANEKLGSPPKKLEVKGGV